MENTLRDLYDVGGTTNRNTQSIINRQAVISQSIGKYSDSIEKHARIYNEKQDQALARQGATIQQIHASAQGIKSQVVALKELERSLAG